MDPAGRNHTSIEHFLGAVAFVCIVGDLAAVGSAALLDGNYKEQATWRDAATGRIIAQSDIFELLNPGSLDHAGIRRLHVFPDR
jgi:hypothetical protein